MRTASSIYGLNPILRLRYLYDIFVIHLREAHDFAFLRIWEQQITDVLRRWSPMHPSQMSVMEIGFGQRPARLIWATGLFGSVSGIDLDRPVLSFSWRALLKVIRTNGLLRGVKTGCRSLLFDQRYYRALLDHFEKRFGYLPDISDNLFEVGDAARRSAWEARGPVDLIYSEGVFEHIPANGIEAICRTMAEMLQSNGLALITVNVFTGITGGHIPEWYGHDVNNGMPKQTRPWGHLRGDRLTADTYLNQLRLSDYEDIFARFFQILDRQKFDYGIGEPFLTPVVQAELSDYSRDELLTDYVRFVLRPRRV
jgi:hypothetical protein